MGFFFFFAEKGAGGGGRTGLKGDFCLCVALYNEGGVMGCHGPDRQGRVPRYLVSPPICLRFGCFAMIPQFKY